MFKKSVFLVLSVFLFLIMFSSSSFAYTVTTVGGYGPYQAGQGGEFTLNPSADLEWVLSGYSLAKDTRNAGTTGSLAGIADDTFQTFCLEHNEYIYANTTFDVTISNAATLGGTTNSSDPISIGTEYLYYNFASGLLGGYNFNGTEAQREASALALQNTIWWLEGDIADPGNAFSSLVVSQFGNSTAAMADNNGTYNVAVLNMWAAGHPGDLNFKRQDQLVITPTPIPGALLLLGSGLIGLVGIRRRMKR
jgi:hypothetical protein